jgi:nucleotide-binding universal stress UspA family protein
MDSHTHDGPVLFCYDGSEGSRSAMRSVAALIATPVDSVVLTVWEPIGLQLALSGTFVAGGLPSDDHLDEREEAAARSAAEEGAERALEYGYRAKPLIREGRAGVVHTILEVADELSARLIVCGQRGRGPLKATLLGSVSHALAAHTPRPILVAPETAHGTWGSRA